MCHSYRMIFTLVTAIVAMLSAAQAQDNPYRIEEGWAKLPEGRKWGATSGSTSTATATSGCSRGAENAPAPARTSRRSSSSIRRARP